MSKTVYIPYAWHCRWFDKDGDESWEQYEESHPATKHWDTFPDKIVPLYTHPVKQLSDEEINDIYDMWQAMSGDPVKLYQLFKSKEITE